jgi:RHS repeat-associated protein
MSSLARTTEINCDTRAANEDCINGGSRTRTKYQYDNANRLTQIAQGTNVIGLAYDAANRKSSVTLPNGIVATPSFDAANQLLALSYNLSGTHIGDLAYTYDAAGRRITQTGSLATLNVPTSVSSASYDVANRLTNWGGSALNYDANGNLTGVAASTFSWNTRNQLVGTSDGGGIFAYDSLGRRANRTVSGVATPYVHDGLNPATVGGSSILAGQGLDDFYAETNASATTSYVSDGLGSTVAATNSSGAVVGNNSYGPYGTTQQSGTTATAFQYTGRENDGATNLYYYRNRYYSPTLNRFVSQDPIGLAGGANMYAYASGNPITNIDPLGLIDHNEQETLLLLQQAYNSATAGRIQGLLNIQRNSEGKGPYDFGYTDAMDDTWTRCGVTMDADHFANYVAGFQGAAYDDAFYWTTGFIWAETAVKGAGILYHITGRTKAVNDPWDRTGFPMINAGERDGENFANKKQCGCGQ